MTISELNAMPKEEWVTRLGGVYEHSPWIIEIVGEHRPFPGIEQMLGQMRAVVRSAGVARQLALLRAHPDLAGKLAVAHALTECSRQEQAGAGLDRLSPEEFAEFSALNSRYRQTFGFPFILCVRNTDKAGILHAFQERIEHSPDEEIDTALAEVHEIARWRLRDLLLG